MININRLVSSNYKEAEETLKKKYKEYQIIDVTYKRKWNLKEFGKKYCEVLYAYDNNEDKKEDVQNKQVINNLNLITSEIYERFEDIQESIESLSKEIKYVLSKTEENEDIFKLIENTLIKNGVAVNIAKEIVKKVINSIPRDKRKEKSTIIYKTADIIREYLKLKEGFDLDKDKIIAFIGPTGVGKTTTLAKIAGILYKQKKNADIGIITLDTYRMGAVQQIMEYASIINADVEVCNTLEDLDNALVKFMSKDYILIDTAGRSQKKIEVEYELKDMIDLINPDKLVLVLSATTKVEDLNDCIEKFSIFDFNSFIFTKLDETNTYGNILNVSYNYPKVKTSYFTTGQEVPEDIEIPKAEKIVKSVLLIEEKN